MADSDLERSHHPTPRRIQEAREKGQVARSRELSTAVTVLAVGLYCWWAGPSIAGQVHELVSNALRLDHTAVFENSAMFTRLTDLSWQALMILLPFFAFVFIVDLAAPLLVGGWNFSLQAVQPDFARLNPLKGFGRIFSSHGLAELIKALIKCAIIGALAVWFIGQHWAELSGIAFEAAPQGIGHASKLIFLILLFLAGGLAVIAALDVPYQLWHYYDKLKMNVQELKEEAKESEGDPQLRARIRSQQREVARKRMMEAVPKADVVVTNPTHYAVALAYSDGKMMAPKVVAKGMNLLAEKIRTIAGEHNVPVMEAPPLARALYRHAEIGQEIPQTLYAAVAQILAYVYQLRYVKRFGGELPIVPNDLPVPSELDPGEVSR